MPAFSGTVLLSREQSIGGNVGLELCFCSVEKIQDLFHDRANVVFIDETERELECSPADGDVVFFETV